MYSRPLLLPRSDFIRPQKALQKPDAWDAAFAKFTAVINRWRYGRLSPYQSLLPAIHHSAEALERLTDEQLFTQAAEVGTALRQSQFATQNVADAFALVRETAGRCLGMRHFDSQLLGGLALLYGNIAEMQTGEGKTLTATLPTATAALAGIPVHVVTVNDYLAKRDCEEMTPVYQALGLTVACVLQGMSIEERQVAYASDIVYCTNNELVFDYLKDQIEIDSGRHALNLHAQRLKGNRAVTDKIMLNGLHFAIVDEADSILMDEAITPLIISATTQANQRESLVYQQALDIAKLFVEDKHFDLDAIERRVALLPAGEEFAQQIVQQRAVELGPFWRGRVRRIELVSQALSALYLFQLDQHYLLRDGKVQIIDQHTGRVMPDRSWEKGLHQLIEIKEGCELSKPRVTLEKISYQRFFRLYHHLAGMTGTAAEVSAECWSVYQLPVVKIPTHKKSLRLNYETVVCDNLEQKWDVVVQSVSRALAQGRAVLIGTSSVANSERLSEQLNIQCIGHKVLNAKQDEHEADIVAQAGQVAKVTIATSMAGRGTDIKLAKDVADAGGLHVILTELQDSSRIDRQLAGRCARMGDPGSVEYIISVEDAIRDYLPEYWFKLANHSLFKKLFMRRFAKRINHGLLRKAQKTQEKRHFKMRSNLLKTDDQQGELLAFAGKRV